MSLDRDGMQFEPGKFWSLWDFMRRLPVKQLMELDIALARAVAQYDHASAATEIGEDGAKIVAGVFLAFEALGAHPDFTPEAHNLVMVARAGLNAQTKNGVALNYLSSIHEVFKSELSKKGCFMLEQAEMAFADQQALFGEQVAAAFPSAAMDIREIGNCFAAERYNAAAYHCVQAAEIALRELARDRRVSLNDHRKPMPLDHAQWGQLLGKLTGKVGDIHKWDIGPVRDAAFRFYDHAMLDFNGINDGWRSHLSHARQQHQFERDDIIGLMAHVRRVMQSLARRLGEGRTVTPEIWKRVPPELAD
jgi:hypothetical protein